MGCARGQQSPETGTRSGLSGREATSSTRIGLGASWGRRWTAGTFEKRELARCGGTIYAALCWAGLGGSGGARETVAMMISRSKARGSFPAQGDEWGFARYGRFP